jgi:putative endonuclease
MKQFNRKTGISGESIAARMLQDKGYTILERNFSNRFGEIDIIAKDKDTLVFVEVKAKTGVEYGTPEEMVGRGKLQRIRNMATLYMKGKLVPCRIDVVAIVLGENNDVVRLTHYENVT